MPVKKVINTNKITWYYDFRVNGVRYRGAVPGARNKQQAEIAETQIRSEVYQGKYDFGSGRQTLKEFVEKVYQPWAKANKRSWDTDASRLKPIVAFFGEKRFSQITPFMIERFKSERRNTPIGRQSNNEGHHASTHPVRQRTIASVNREIGLLSRIFSMAIVNRQAQTNPCRQVKRLPGEQPRTRYLLPEEEGRLMEALAGPRAHLRPIVLLAINTGMRRGEILRLQWEHVDFFRGEIKVTQTKTSRDRFVPMNEVVRKSLADLRKEGQGDLVFPSAVTGRRFIDVKNAFRGACKQAGIRDFRFHDLRHTFGTRAADAGVPINAIADVMGHADIHTTQRYSHATDEGRRRAVDAAVVHPEKLVKIWSKRASGANSE